MPNKLGPLQRQIILYLQANKGAALLRVVLEKFTKEYNNNARNKKTKQITITGRIVDQLDKKGLVYLKDRDTPDCTVRLTFQGKEFRP